MGDNDTHTHTHTHTQTTYRQTHCTLNLPHDSRELCTSFLSSVCCTPTTVYPI